MRNFAQHLPPALLNNLLVVGCAILLKETVNLNKLKNHVGILLGNRQTKTDSHYKRLTRFFNATAKSTALGGGDVLMATPFG